MQYPLNEMPLTNTMNTVMLDLARLIISFYGGILKKLLLRASVVWLMIYYLSLRCQQNAREYLAQENCLFRSDGIDLATASSRRVNAFGFGIRTRYVGI